MGRVKKMAASALACAISLGFVIGCSKEPEVSAAKSSPRPQPQAAPVVPTDNTQAPPPPQAPAAAPAEAEMAATPAAPANSEPLPFKYEATDALTDLARQFRNEKGRSPTSIQELVTAGMTTKLPEPPPGKHFVIDSSMKNDVRVVLK